jgi:hypothetical protein
MPLLSNVILYNPIRRTLHDPEMVKPEKFDRVHLARTGGDPRAVQSVCGMLYRLTGEYVEVERADVGYNACQRCEDHVGYELAYDPPEPPEHERSLPARAVELYLMYRNITDTARQLRVEGYRLPDGMSVQPQHIEGLMAAGAPDMDGKKYAQAYEIFENGRELMMRHKG